MMPTETLRALLDERGVEWKEHRHVMPGSMAIQRETLWGQPTDVASGKPIPHVYHYRATEMGDGRLFLEAQLVTPEQAIAATMGRGMLTADDVRDLIERHSDASCGNGRDFHNGAYVAIADELNATLGSYNCTNSERTETCKVDVLNTGDCAGYECSEYIMHCNGCGHEFGYVLYNEDGDVWMSEPPKYCPNCGRRIVDPTTNDVDAEVCE